jgi:hypothetical protein
MSFSAAGAGNFQFFPSLGGGCWKRFGSRRLKIFQNFLKKFLPFEKFLHKKSEK